MVNPRIPTARQAKPGMLVRQQALDLALTNLASEHIIATVEHTYVNPDDLRTEYFVIKTNYGIWTFSPDELVTFPRRPDNSITDWRTSMTPPLPLDLAIGDLLPPRIKSEDPNASQRVTAVTHNRARPGIIQVTTYSEEDHVLSTMYGPHEPVIFPRSTTAPQHRDTGYDSTAPLTAYGPYKSNDPEQAKHGLLYLLEHPAGGGRWPAYLENPIPLGNSTFMIKPPGARAKADLWPIYVGSHAYKRHPKDPGWGKNAHAYINPERLAEAEAAYAAYRARAEGAEA